MRIVRCAMKSPLSASRLLCGGIAGFIAAFPGGAAIAAPNSAPAPVPAEEKAGRQPGGGELIATGQALHPAGKAVYWGGRPVDLALSPDGKTLYSKDSGGLVVIDVATWTVRQKLHFDQKEGGSMHGILVAPDGLHIYLTSAQKNLWEAEIDADGKAKWSRSILLSDNAFRDKSFKAPDSVHSTGMALSSDGKTLYVCLANWNAVSVIDLAAGKCTAQIPVGVAPFGIALSPDGKFAYVTNWGGRRPKAGEKTAGSLGTEHGEGKSHSAGSDVLVDARGIANSGTLSKIDLQSCKVLKEFPVGLHPCALAMNRQGTRLFVANSNSDTVSVVDPASGATIENIAVRPDASLPFGSLPNALALSPDERTLYVANGGNNAVAVISLAASGKSAVQGYIPAGWFPTAVATDGHQLYVANVRGEGQQEVAEKYRSTQAHGSVNAVPVPDVEQLKTYTAQVRTDARVPQILMAQERARAGTKAVPVPARSGEASVFNHVIYVIKENRTYDQVFGDMKQGNGDPKLCTFGSKVTPNQHALAAEFGLLDNYYCNGVLSADGHAWAIQGMATDYLEKQFGGFTRAYDFGTDALAFASSGFIWDKVLLRGLSFRNYGEPVFTDLEPKRSTWKEVSDDHTAAGGTVKIVQNLDLEPLKRYTDMAYPGWNLNISDQIRMDEFLKEFADAEKTGQWPNFMIVYLPQDHTHGLAAKAPTPNACVADNDYALGRMIDAISHSRFWKDTCIFVNEDDPQAGYDHVDGQRSTCLVVSAYNKRNAVVHQFYNQGSVLHTMERILGVPEMNQMDAMAPTMDACFADTLNLEPYTVVKNEVPFDEVNAAGTKAATASERMDFSKPDLINENSLNRMLWAYSKPGVPYPAKFAGHHGRGLKALHLRLIPVDDDDDEG